jgi:hypothetical protein
MHIRRGGALALAVVRRVALPPLELLRLVALVPSLVPLLASFPPLPPHLRLLALEERSEEDCLGTLLQEVGLVRLQQVCGLKLLVYAA